MYIVPAVFTEVAENLFTLERELRFRYGLTLLTRMSIIRRGTDLWVHSPLPGDDWYTAIRDLGVVRFLVAPSCLHCSYIAAAKEHFPDAILTAPSELRLKRPELPIELELGGDAEQDPGWPEGLVPLAVGGAPKVAEHLFYDSHTRSLLVTDLVFDNDRGANLSTRILLGLFAPTGRPSRSREWGLLLIKNREAFRSSLAALDALKIDRVIGAHGRIIDDVPLALSLMKTGKPPQLD